MSDDMSDNLTAIFLSSSNHLINGLVAIAIFVGLPWLILHYIAKFRGNRQLSAQDAEAFEHLGQKAMRMEQRMLALERILDAELPDWRQTHGIGARSHETI